MAAIDRCFPWSKHIATENSGFEEGQQGLRIVLRHFDSPKARQFIANLSKHIETLHVASRGVLTPSKQGALSVIWQETANCRTEGFERQPSRSDSRHGSSPHGYDVADLSLRRPFTSAEANPICYVVPRQNYIWRPNESATAGNRYCDCHVSCISDVQDMCRRNRTPFGRWHSLYSRRFSWQSWKVIEP